MKPISQLSDECAYLIEILDVTIKQRHLLASSGKDSKRTKAYTLGLCFDGHGKKKAGWVKEIGSEEGRGPRPLCEKSQVNGPGSECLCVDNGCRHRSKGRETTGRKTNCNEQR